MLTRPIGFWRRLDVRLIAIICATVIPINLLAIIFGKMVTDEATNKLSLYAKHEFERYVNEVNAQNDALADWHERYEAAHLKQLAYPRGFNAVKSINMINEMSTEFSKLSPEGFIILKERYEEKKLLLKGTRAIYTFGDITDLRSALVNQPDYLEPGDRLLYLSGRWFYIVMSKYRNYSVGFALDIGRLYERIKRCELINDCELLISDGETYLLARPSEVLIEIDKRSVEAFTENNEEQLSGTIVFASEELTVDLSDNWKPNTVPAAYLTLQIVAWCSVALVFLLGLIIRRIVLRPLGELQTGIEQLDRDKSYRITTSARTGDFGYIFTAFNKMADDLDQSRDREVLLYQTQLDNLMLQVNPHMLLNSLSMIYSMAETGKNALIQRFAMCLVGYFRYCLKEDDSLVPLETEIEFVKNYIEIQKMRFPGEVSSTYLIEPEVEHAFIPRLLIENFVENAVKYGRLPDRVTEVLIWAREQNGKLAITVRDTGKGMPSEILERLNNGEPYSDSDGTRHIGVWNCRRRLFAFFGSTADIVFSTVESGGTTVDITIPIIDKEEAGHESANS